MRLGKQFRQEFEKQNIVCSVRVTNGVGDAERWSLAAAPSGFDAIVVIGGDGTVGEVVAGQARSDKKIPISVVPVGTANVVAIALALPLFPTMVKSNILQGRILEFDVGYAPDYDRHFLLMAALGYPAKVIKDSPRKLKNLFGVFSYAWAGIRNALNLDEVDFFIEDETGMVRQISGNTVLLANIGKISDINLKVNPNTSAHDGKFDVTVISSRSFWQLAMVIVRMLTWRGRGFSPMQNFQASRVIVRSDPPVDVQIDGENMGRTPFETQMRPKGVKLIVGQRYNENI